MYVSVGVPVPRLRTVGVQLIGDFDRYQGQAAVSHAALGDDVVGDARAEPTHPGSLLSANSGHWGGTSIS